MHDAIAIYDELKDVPGFAFPPGEPSDWTDEEQKWAVREGTDDSLEWIRERRWLISAGRLVR